MHPAQTEGAKHLGLDGECPRILIMAQKPRHGMAGAPRRRDANKARSVFGIADRA